MLNKSAEHHCILCQISMLLQSLELKTIHKGFSLLVFIHTALSIRRVQVNGFG